MPVVYSPTSSNKHSTECGRGLHQLGGRARQGGTLMGGTGDSRGLGLQQSVTPIPAEGTNTAGVVGVDQSEDL